MNTQTIPISRIDVGSDRRALSRPAVKRLAASIGEVGLLSPISVYPVGDAFELIAGRHRIEAVKSLGWTEIDAVLVDLAAVDREIAEIDENLVRHALTAADECRQTARRSDLYLMKHPETKQGGLPGKAGGGKAKNAEIASFAADTAQKTGRSRRAIEVDAQIGKSIPDDVFEAIQDTPLADSKTDLLALARLPEAAQREVVSTVDLSDKAAVRAAVAEHRPVPLPAPEPDHEDRLFGSIIGGTANEPERDFEPEYRTTEVQITVESFARAVVSLFTADECREVISLIREAVS